MTLVSKAVGALSGEEESSRHTTQRPWTELWVFGAGGQRVLAGEPSEDWVTASLEVRLTCLDFIPRMAEGTNRVRELGPLKSVGGTWVGDGGMEAGKVGRCSRFSCQSEAVSFFAAL